MVSMFLRTFLSFSPFEDCLLFCKDLFGCSVGPGHTFYGIFLQFLKTGMFEGFES